MTKSGVMMHSYGNRNGNSGIRAYEIGEQSIAVEFVSGEIYLYTDASAGKQRIAKMKKLALEGEGLSTYISRYVKNRYARRIDPEEFR